MALHHSAGQATGQPHPGAEESLENLEICCARKQEAVQDQSLAVASPREASPELHPCTDSKIHVLSSTAK